MNPNNLRISAADLFLLVRQLPSAASSSMGLISRVRNDGKPILPWLRRSSCRTYSPNSSAWACKDVRYCVLPNPPPDRRNLVLTQRQPYVDQLQQRRIISAADLSEQDRETLARLRQPPAERVLTPGGGIWLRTCYQAGSNAAFAALVQSADLPELPPGFQIIFDDASLYDFGPDGWQRIFTRMPQMLEREFFTAQDYERKKQQALEAAMDAEAEDRKQAEEDGYDPDEDATPWQDLYEGYHWAVAIGNLYIIDEKALASAGPDAGKLLVAWFDDCGRVVRSARQTAAEASDTMGLIESGYVRDHAVWTNADPGEEYEWDAPLGPPYGSDVDDEEGDVE